MQGYIGLLQDRSSVEKVGRDSVEPVRDMTKAHAQSSARRSLAPPWGGVFGFTSLLFCLV